ncbi:MAG TPA: 1-deoxy-D-xylulose-5-phosphate reductoisomerase, partial [Gemmatales bacterium]|nr:1-deoxy-D-xylulose-5-phosphate reductoisomerase [Gemmatales bacterium]
MSILHAGTVSCCPQTGKRRVALLGASGSIGTSTLDVISALPEKLSLFGFTVHTSVDRLQQIAKQFSSRLAIITSSTAEAKLVTACEVLCGADQITRLIQHPDVDMVLSAIVGAAGLQSSLAALESGKPLALANKETLVVAGPLVMELAQRKNVPLLPVDSEHSAIFQVLQERGTAGVERIVLTASGGPFRGRTKRELQDVTCKEAL